MERRSKPQRGCDRHGGYAGVMISSRISVLVATPLGPLGLNAEHENVATTMLRSQSRIGITLEMPAWSKTKSKAKSKNLRYIHPNHTQVFSTGS